MKLRCKIVNTIVSCYFFVNFHQFIVYLCWGIFQDIALNQYQIESESMNQQLKEKEKRCEQQVRTNWFHRP